MPSPVTNSRAPRLTTAEAYQYCTGIAQQHYENFPTASRLIKRKLRPAVAAIYAFARAADDMADEGDAPASKRLKQIDAWESLLERCVEEDLDQPVFLALADAIRRFNLPVEMLHNLLIAFRMDVSIHSYATVDELMFYCKHSANPVGRLILGLHGVSGAEVERYSDAICTALQLTNFWQDLKIDIPNGRCYLAEAWLKESGLSSKEVLNSNLTSEQLWPALRLAIAKTGSLYQEGFKILPLLPFRLRLQIAATLHGGMAILKATSELSDPMNNRPALTKKEWYGLAVNILKSALRPREAINMESA
ncbi:MAG: squalene synthase HpnC [Mariprofundaceae bacterium]